MAHKISKKLSYIGENIRKIRQVKRISQADFASIFNLARPSVGAYEEGRSEPKIDTILQIANYYRISIDVLLTRKLTVSDILSFGLLNEKLNKVHQLKGTKGNSYKNPPIPYIQIGQYLDYIVNHGNSDYIKNLPEVNIPLNKTTGEFRAFEILGSEMEYHQQGIHHGDILVGEKLDPQDLSRKIGEILTVVHKANLSTRRLKALTTNKITLISDHPNYPEMSIPLIDVHEFWIIKSVYSEYLNPPTLIEERVLKVENEIAFLRKQLKK